MRLTSLSYRCYYGSLANRSEWRHALVLDSVKNSGLQLQQMQPVADGVAPFAHSTSPLRIVAKAVLVPSWKMRNCTSMENGCHHGSEWDNGCVGAVPHAQALSEKEKLQPARTVTLLPFGATDLRLAVLPVRYK